MGNRGSTDVVVAEEDNEEEERVDDNDVKMLKSWTKAVDGGFALHIGGM